MKSRDNCISGWRWAKLALGVSMLAIACQTEYAQSAVEASPRTVASQVPLGQPGRETQTARQTHPAQDLQPGNESQPGKEAQPAQGAQEHSDNAQPEKAQEQKLDEAMRRYQEQLRQEEEARRKDPAWQPSHQQVRIIKVGEDLRSGSVHNYCLDRQGNILVGVGGSRLVYRVDEKTQQVKAEVVTEQAEIRVFSPDGKRLGSWKTEVVPQALCVHSDGTVFIGGQGKLAKLSPEGQTLLVVDLPGVKPPENKPDSQPEKQDNRPEKPDNQSETQDNRPEKQDKERPAVPQVDSSQRDDSHQDKPQQQTPQKQPASKSSGVLGAVMKSLGLSSEPAQPEPPEDPQLKAFQQQMRYEVSGIAVSQQDVFVSTRAPTGFGYVVWRFDHQLSNPQLIVKGLSGCCGQMDIQTHNGELWVAENGRHRVNRYDREGKLLGSFGRRDRKAADGFGGCCEPKNLRFTANGELLAAESGPPVAIKRFSTDGKFLGMVGLPVYETGCVRVTVEVSRDARTVFILNPGQNQIHVLVDKRFAPTHQQVATITIPPGKQNTPVRTFCLAADGNILAACGGQEITLTMGKEGLEAKLTGETPAIKVLSPDGKLLDTWKLDFTPQAINLGPDGTVLVGGQGVLAKLDKTGKLLLKAEAPQMAELGPLPPLPDPAAKPPADKQQPEDPQEAAARKAKLEALDAELKQLMEKLREVGKRMQAARSDPQQLKAVQDEYQPLVEKLSQLQQERLQLMITPEAAALQKRAAMLAKAAVTGIAVSQQDVFVATPSPKGFGYCVWRLDHDLKNPQRIVDRLVGCCGQMDIQTHNGDLYVAENSRKRVLRFDREGKQLAVWGKAERGGEEGFGSCCNPMNIRFGPAGEVYTSEASVGRIKRYSIDGQFLGIVGTAEIVPGCKHVPIAISPDGQRVYMLDINRSHIVVLGRKGESELASGD